MVNRFYVSTNDIEKYTTGRDPDFLGALTWDQVAVAERGSRRGMIFADLERLDIRPQVRLTAEGLKAVKAGELDPVLTIYGLRRTLTGEWQEVKPTWALGLHENMKEDATLGARTMRDVVKNHPSGKFENPEAVSARIWFEFRMPSEAALVVATS